MSGIKARLLDIEKRETIFDKHLGIIKNGVDNAYSEKVERLINNSVTAKTASRIMASYIFGKGFGKDNNKIIVNRRKNTTLQKFGQKLANSFTRQRAAFIHINYNANYSFDSFDVLPYQTCRIGKKDDDNYNGKIGVSSCFTDENSKLKDIKFVDVFNNDKLVIEKQVEAAGGWEQYKGQIWHINLDDEYDYALSTIDAVMKDCDSEAQASIFKNKSLRKGFFGKTMVITKPLVKGRDSYNTPEDWKEAIDEADMFTDTIDEFVGAENAGGALHIELEHDGDNFENAIKFENITSDIDDKLFEYTESSVFKNILMAFNNIPTGLVRSDSTLFAQSGESLYAMMDIYQNNTAIERDELEQVVQVLMSNFVKPVKNIEIELFIEPKPTVEEVVEEEETKKIEDDSVSK